MCQQACSIPVWRNARTLECNSVRHGFAAIFCLSVTPSFRKPIGIRVPRSAVRLVACWADHFVSLSAKKPGKVRLISLQLLSGSGRFDLFCDGEASVSTEGGQPAVSEAELVHPASQCSACTSVLSFIERTKSCAVPSRHTCACTDRRCHSGADPVCSPPCTPPAKQNHTYRSSNTSCLP